MPRLRRLRRRHVPPPDGRGEDNGQAATVRLRALRFEGGVVIIAALHRVALMAERYAERVDCATRTYESTQLLVAARSFVRAVELFIEWSHR